MTARVAFRCRGCGRYWPPESTPHCVWFVFPHRCLSCRRARMPADHDAERRHADRRTDPPGLGGVEGLDRRHGDRRDG